MEMRLCPVRFDSISALEPELPVISSCICGGAEVEALDDSTQVKWVLFEAICSISVDEDALVSEEGKSTSSGARVSEAPKSLGECSTEKLSKALRTIYKTDMKLSHYKSNAQVWEEIK